ncbi:uncharacterized protein C6orf118-like [Notolabrus celidotus]|uniref:uncharacterized protein C6orf118-like n=1 Tax=Notolabrus celidotus TaxID=1203425 RepID=UPI0014901E98|nr:uncharacterized protein C6orf118-like [Notolabrus celidotus]
MSSSRPPRNEDYGRGIHRLLQAAEAGQRADILTYSSGHLGPRSLNQSPPHREVKKSFWRSSQGEDERTSNPLTHQQRQKKTQTNGKKKEGRTLPPVFSEVVRLREDQTAGCSSCAEREDESVPEAVVSSVDSLHVQQRVSSASDPEGKLQMCWSYSHQQSLKHEAQRKTEQQFDRQDDVKQEVWAGGNVAERHERKLKKELQKLSEQNRPSRDRLAVFSDVFDDVCEGSPVFGRILREIKTDYDLYVNHLLASQPQHMSLRASVEDAVSRTVREMQLKDAEEEVCRLELEVRGAVEENIRARNDLQQVEASRDPEEGDRMNPSELEDRGTDRGTDSVLIKRLQVWRVWRESQHLEEEIKEKLVPTVTVAATERHARDVKTEIMTLIATNHRLKVANEDLEISINMKLDREKASKTMRRILWEEVHTDLQTD